ncbi:hypothetical protein [Streptomyces sp. 1222.5]|uniref:hypothetical protein n=1 Tax=Streptomyces sp. 1222.5 TaxID=1881026 RepID=UPI003D7506F4
MNCPLGGCDAYGYCPCAEDEPDDEEQLDDVAAGRALVHRGRTRVIETLPPLDTYEPTQEA